jgi:hypothetical protein
MLQYTNFTGTVTGDGSCAPCRIIAGDEVNPDWALIHYFPITPRTLGYENCLNVVFRAMFWYLDLDSLVWRCQFLEARGMQRPSYGGLCPLLKLSRLNVWSHRYKRSLCSPRSPDLQSLGSLSFSALSSAL